MDNKTIVRRFEQLWSDRKIVESTWDKLERYILPIGGGKFFQPQTSEGEMDWQRREVFDDTAILGCDTLAASVHGSLTSPAVKWFDFQFRTPELNEDVGAKAWLDAASTQVWSAIQESNFNLEISEGYLDLCGFGNTAISHEPIDDLTWKGMEFNAVPLRECYFEEKADSSVLRFYRLLQWRPSAMVDKWGKENVPEKIVKMAEQAVTERQSIIFCIYPRDGIEESDEQGILPIDQRPYGFKYVLREGGELLGEEGGYYELPAYMVRWRKASGSQWGYGPGHTAISTVLTLNELVSLVLEAAEKVVDPATLVNHRGLMSDLDLQPGGQSVVKDIDKTVKAFESGSRFDVSALQIGDLRDMVRRIFHVDQLELKESPAMSATEVMVRYELMNRLLGPTMGRLQNDLLDPLVTNTFKMLYRMKQIPAMPDVVKEAGGVVDVEYVGPLSRAQKADEVAAIERWLGTIAQLAEVFPEIRHVPDPIAIAKKTALHLNVDMGLLNDETTITQLIAMETKVQQLMQALEMAEKDAKVQQGEQGGGAQAPGQNNNQAVRGV